MKPMDETFPREMRPDPNLKGPTAASQNLTPPYGLTLLVNRPHLGAMEIAIIGGGIAGLASAIALAGHERRIVILERASAIEEHGAGVQLGPNALRAVRDLGLWEKLSSKLFAPAGLQIMDALTGDPIRRFCFGPRFESRFGAPYSLVHRRDLIEALRDAAVAAAGVELLTGRHVKALHFENEAPVLALADGSSLCPQAVIGADGIGSTIRQSLLGDGRPATHACRIYRTMIPRITATALPSDVVLWLYPGGHVVHYPVAGGQQMNLVAVAAGGPATGDGSCAADEVLACFPAMSADLRYILGLAPDWTRWPAADRSPADVWGRAATTLVGDAAHPMLPFLAQGAAAALVDAVTLGRCASAEPKISAAFRHYEALRKDHTARLQRLSRRQGKVYHLEGWRADLRNRALAILPESLFFSRIGWIYA
jgi:2-polyprenyl-6-methoxyphenol hydroxylase-like FAD-dependent oxidoreductase